MNRNACYRRFQERKHKKYAHNILKHIFHLDKENANNIKNIGIFACSHTRHTCPIRENSHNQNLKLIDKLTLAEQKANIDFKEEKFEFYQNYCNNS